MFKITYLADYEQKEDIVFFQFIQLKSSLKKDKLIKFD